MRALAYQRSEPANCCILGPAAASMTSAGFEGASVAKKKSAPRLIQALPSLRSLASKVAVIASRRFGLFALASSISSRAVDFSAARAGHGQALISKKVTNANIHGRCIGKLPGNAWPLHSRLAAHFAVAIHELLRGPKRCAMLFRQMLHQFELHAEFTVQGLSIIADHIQSAALVRPVGTKRR